jgi:excisionase family DNA binding protein
MGSNRGRSKQADLRPEPASGDDALVDIDWVARRLGVTVRHVRRLVAERRIPLVKWGHLLRFDPTEIDAWVDEARQPQAR